MGVILRVVVQDEVSGDELVAGKPKLRVIRETTHGGMVDTHARPPRYVGPSRKPQVWHCGEAQEPLILHAAGEPLRLLVYGAMGAGKTEILAMWAWLQVLALIGTGLQVGLTAPTQERTVLIRDAMVRRAPESWYRGGTLAKGWSERRQIFRFANGVTAKLVSTKLNSSIEGSRIQGYNWAACGSDELQDSVHADSDIEARGRAAPGGRYKRLGTCTPKDSADWRAFSEGVRAIPLWGLRTIAGLSNPFVPRDWWDQLRQTMSLRDYQRKAEGLDPGPERAVYTSYLREHNIRPIPRIGATDITLRVVTESMLLGNDPGSYRDVTILLRCLRLGKSDVRHWWAVGEVTTEGQTFEAHVLAVKALLQSAFNMQHDDDPESLRGLVRCEPYGDSEARPDHYFYKAWRAEGFRVTSAAFRNGEGKNARVPLEAGVEMINRLLCNAAGVRRLFIDCDEHGKPACPKLAEALQSFERDAAYKAKGDKRHKEHDLSDWPMALTLALWPYERLKDGDGIRRAGAIY